MQTEMNQRAEGVVSEIKELVAKHANCSVESLTTETCLGEDLKIVDDDAEELLDEFARKFGVDMSRMVFGEYFPDEASPEMHYYLAVIARNRNQNPLLRIMRQLGVKVWKIFVDKTSFKIVTIEDLLSAVQTGHWE